MRINLLRLKIYSLLFRESTLSPLNIDNFKLPFAHSLAVAKQRKYSSPLNIDNFKLPFAHSLAVAKAVPYGNTRTRTRTRTNFTSSFSFLQFRFTVPHPERERTSFFCVTNRQTPYISKFWT